MIRIAHIGYGYWGKNLARNFAEIGALAAIVDPYALAAEAGSAALNVPARSFDEVLADASIDGISIASPAEQHFEHASAALNADKHVFVEKPLALDVKHAESLCALAKSRGRVLMVGHLLQYHPVFSTLRDMNDQGIFGKIRYIYSNRMSLGKFRSEENVLWSFAPHDFSMILALLGEEPNNITAQGCASFNLEIADMVTVQMAFPSGVKAHVQVSWMHPFKEQRLVLIGEKAMAVFEDSNADWTQKLAIYNHKFDATGPAILPIKSEPSYVDVPRSEPLKNECQHFVDCINSDCDPLTGGEEGLSVLKVLSRAERALSTSLTSRA